MMINSPGLVAAKDIPGWLDDTLIIEMTGWTYDQVVDCPVETKRRLLTLMGGRARAADQQARKDKLRSKPR